MKSAVLLFICIVSSAQAQVGATIDSLTLRSSTGAESTLTHCKVIKVEPDGVRVTHDAGVAKVPYEAMPEAWKAAAPIDAARVKEFQEQEKEKSAKYAEWMKEEKRKAMEAEENKKNPNKLTGQEKLFQEARRKHAEKRKKWGAEVLALGRRMVADGRATQAQLEQWAREVDARQVSVGMPSEFADYALDSMFERTTSSDGGELWQTSSGLIYLRGGKVVRWVNTN